MIYIQGEKKKKSNCKLQEVKWGEKITGKQRPFVGSARAKQSLFKPVGQVKKRDGLSFNKKSPRIAD